MIRILYIISILAFASLSINETLGQSSADNELVNSLFNNLYSFRFKDAESDLKIISSGNIDDDLKDICIANFHWWNIATRYDYEKNANEMLPALDRIIDRYSTRPCNRLNPDEIFAIAHAYAYKTRLDMHEGNYIKGAKNLKQAAQYLDIILPRAEENIKFKLLAGLYHYILGSVLEKYPVFHPLFIFSPGTDSDKGLQYLAECAQDKNPLIKTEARYFLMRVQHEVNNEYSKADSTALMLINDFPQNIYFRSYRINILADSGRNIEIENELQWMTPANKPVQADIEQHDFIVNETNKILRKKKNK